MIIDKVKNKIKYIYSYGFIFTLKIMYYRRTQNFVKRKALLAKKINDLCKAYNYNQGIIDFKEVNTLKYKDKIWVLWWQGMENAPELIKICMSNKKKYIKGREIIILTKDNLKKYVQLPGYILDKFNSGGLQYNNYQI